MKSDWIEYKQLAEEHLWIVLRRWGETEYVVHLYNEQDGGYYHGIYCRDLEKAQIAYRDKLLSYQGKTIIKPQNLISVLYQIRQTGLVNMADRESVGRQALNYGYHRVAQYLKDNAQDYYDTILIELGEYIENNAPKSLAQQLADEMGWEVIVD